MTSPAPIRIAPTLALPIDIAGEVTTIIAKRGAGKTNAGKVVAEEVLDTGLVQVVVLDPIGVWWALRAGADGKPRGGYDIAVFGGMHGDLPLEETAGKLLAETVVDSGQSVILDVSDFDSDGAMQRFVYDFAERLYRLKQAKPTPLLLILEESDEFAPQDTRGVNVARMVGAIARIAKRGRGRGLGLVPITQRSAALNKNVLDQSDTLVILRTTGPRDRKAIKDWTEHQKAEGFEQIAPALPGLKTGEAFVWTPERELLERVKIRKSRTFDSGRTPTPGEVVVEAEVKPIDLDALGAKMKATVERVKENDPALLRKQIAELRRELASRPTETREVPVETVVEVPIFTPEEWDSLNALFAALPEETRRLAEFAASIEIGLHEFAKKLMAANADMGERATAKVLAELAQREQDAGAEGLSTGAASSSSSRPVPAASTPNGREHPPGLRTAAADVEVQLDTGARRLLDVLARHHPMRLVPSQLALLAGRKARGGAWNKSMKQLRDGGYVIEHTSGLGLTDLGIDASGADLLEPVTPREVIDRWRSALPAGPLALFDLLCEIHPRGLTSEEAAERLGRQPRGGAWNSSMSTLVRNGLVEKANGELRASDTLFGVAA